MGKLCKGGVGRALTQRWVLGPITISEQKHCTAITGQPGQPGSLAERPDGDNTNDCRCSLKNWYFRINAQIQSGCCALDCCRQAFPKALGCPHQALTACDHWRNQTQMLQDLHDHTEMCIATGNHWRRETWGQLDHSFGCRLLSPALYSAPGFRGSSCIMHFPRSVSSQASQSRDIHHLVNCWIIYHREKSRTLSYTLI